VFARCGLGVFQCVAGARGAALEGAALPPSPHAVSEVVCAGGSSFWAVIGPGGVLAARWEAWLELRRLLPVWFSGVVLCLRALPVAAGPFIRVFCCRD